MHHTQQRYAEVKALNETLWDVSCGENVTDAILESYSESSKLLWQVGTEMIQWAMARMQATIPASQYAQISHLEEATRRNVMRRRQLEDVCFRFSGR